jgi:electron transport complex protein RnfG
MGYVVRLGIILMVVGCISAGGLALLNSRTAPIIAEYKRMEQERARLEVMPGAEFGVFVLRDSASALPYYEAYADSEATELLGYVFTAAGNGYSSLVETVVGIDLDWNITGIKVISQQETPGLGTKAVEVRYGEDKPWFQEQFRNKPSLGIMVDKDGGEIVSITGATITSRTISDAIRNGANSLKEKVPVREETAMEESQ